MRSIQKSIVKTKPNFILTDRASRRFVLNTRKTIRHARQYKTVKSPFFPRYLFVKLDLKKDRWRSVNGTFGVSSMIMRGEQPKPVPHGIIENLIRITDANGIISFEQELQIGNSVRVLSGPFANLVGELITVDDSGRVKVLLEILGGQFPVNSTAELLAPAV